MFAFPGMLVPAAEAAGIKVPYDPENYKAIDFPHFHVLVQMQLGRSMPYPSCVFDNAKLIAGFSIKEIKTVTPAQLIEKGYA